MERTASRRRPSAETRRGGVAATRGAAGAAPLDDVAAAALGVALSSCAVWGMVRSTESPSPLPAPRLLEGRSAVAAGASADAHVVAVIG